MRRFSGLRFGAVLLALALGVTFAAGVVVLIGHWTPAPGKLLTHDVYNSAFTVHGAPTLVLLFVILLMVTRRTHCGAAFGGA